MNIQYDALTRPITAADIATFRRDPAYNISLWYSWWSGAAIAGILSMPVAFSFISIATKSVLLYVLLYLTIVAVSAVLGAVLMLLLRKNVETKLYRFVQFSRDNNFTYTQKIHEPFYPGMIFQEGHSRYSKDVYSGTANTTFEIGNYFYTTGSGKSQQTHDWGYVAIPLKRRVPNMVLDAQRNNTSLFGLKLTNLPSSFKKDQTLRLEGDFNEHFTLYAPKEYERDALYIFTPDLMALLIDNSALYDVETVDDKLYIYSSLKFDLQNPTILQKLFTIIDTVGKKTLSQTSYYADENVGDRSINQVAAPGKRLKRSLSTASIIMIIIVMFYIFTMFLG